ncbi:DUF2381 family protein [Corallococcus exercitus]|uniref:DUF2381 family protein n=1 Tax=Corallococcus exercitus TaxID=2316736 RepID=A0A7Y4NDZ4_9BACT|nr:DUF2381 family protein [Corallococcus exercitus]NOK10419.1 DUF2381 family protein [Corallococcus exercitus]
MIQPFRLALALALAWGAAAHAEPLPEGRVRRERPVTVASTAGEPLPMVHIAQDTPTLLLFPAPIQRKSLTFDESRIRVLDAGERSVIVQAVSDLRKDEQQELGVFFADGRAPARAAFSLVTDPAEVDTRIDVQRPALPDSACPTAAQSRVPQPEDFVLLGYVDEMGVTTSEVDTVESSAQGLSSNRSMSFRGKGWVLVDLQVLNGMDRPAWTPREALLVGRVGGPLRARLVNVQGDAIPPGKERRVLVVADTQGLEASASFTLEVRGDGGRSLTIQKVRFPRPAPGEAR